MSAHLAGGEAAQNIYDSRLRLSPSGFGGAVISTANERKSLYDSYDCVNEAVEKYYINDDAFINIQITGRAMVAVREVYTVPHLLIN